MTIDTYDISPALKASIGAKKGAVMKYRWLDLEPGKCFTVSDKDTTFGNLTTLAYRTGKRYNKKFKVIHHKEQGIFEVGRIDGISNE